MWDRSGEGEEAGRSASQQGEEGSHSGVKLGFSSRTSRGLAPGVTDPVSNQILGTQQ